MARCDVPGVPKSVIPTINIAVKSSMTMCREIVDVLIYSGITLKGGARMGKKDRFQLKPLDEDALFRFHIVTRVLNLESLGELRSHAISVLAKQPHVDLKGEEKSVGERSIYRWLKEHKEHGTEGLRNHHRGLITTSVVITPDQLAFFKKLQSHSNISRSLLIFPISRDEAE